MTNDTYEDIEFYENAILIGSYSRPKLLWTYAYYHVNESQPYRTETNNLTWSWIDDTMEGIVFDYGVNGVTYFDNVWVREHNLSGKLNGKVVVFVDSKYNRN